jgi:hypothetical protein
MTLTFPGRLRSRDILSHTSLPLPFVDIQLGWEGVGNLVESELSNKETRQYTDLFIVHHRVGLTVR